MNARKARVGGAPTARPRRSQAERRERTRAALLEAAARGLSREGYGNLTLEQVANEAGYTRGALYHLFANKEELALAVLDWIDQTWRVEVGRHFGAVEDPVAGLMAVARAHALYCRRDVARVMMTLRVEFSDQEHPVGRALKDGEQRLIEACSHLIAAARQSGAIPHGPPPRATARALLGALEGSVIHMAGQAPYDVELAERAVRGVLGLPAVSEVPAARATFTG